MREIIDAWQGKRILVAGDPMYDCYHWGKVERVSPEAPVPVFIEEAIETRPGGAYNVCQNLAALGCIPVQCFPPEPWTVKRRFMVGTHQLLRVDKDQHYEAPADLEPDLNGISAVVLSDYAKGWLTLDFTPKLIERCIGLAIPTIVDPKSDDWGKFHECSVICPNEREYGLSGSAQWWKRPIFIKRGAKGLSLRTSSDQRQIAECTDQFQDFPATARHVYDVTGAGDTVVATLAAALAAGASLEDGARLANLAAGWVVGEVGTAACSAETLRGLL